MMLTVVEEEGEGETGRPSEEEGRGEEQRRVEGKEEEMRQY